MLDTDNPPIRATAGQKEILFRLSTVEQTAEVSVNVLLVGVVHSFYGPGGCMQELMNGMILHWYDFYQDTVTRTESLQDLQS